MGWHEIKIVQIITRTDAIGGAQMHLRDLSAALIRDGHTVLVLAGGDGPFAGALAGMSIPFKSLGHLRRELNPAADWRAFWEIRAILKEIRPDLVCLHSSKAGWLGRLAARSLGMPSVFTAHGWAFTGGVPRVTALFYRAVERFASRFTDAVITVSDYDRQLAIKYGIAPPGKLITVRNGIPASPGSAASDPSKQPPRLMMVGRFEEPKDQAALLEALPSLAAKAWSLSFIGDGSLRPRAEKLASELGLGERIEFLGTRADVPALLAQAQIFLLLSNWEGLPLSVLEAMRAGLPVIASNVGGVAEAVVDGETGCLIGRGDLGALSGCLSELIEAPAKRAELGRKGRLRFESLFQFERTYAETLAVYGETAARAGRNRRRKHGTTAETLGAKR